MNHVKKGPREKIAIVLATTIPETIFSTMEELIPCLLKNNFNVVAVASEGQWLFPEDVRKKFSIPYVTIPFTRVISPLRDIQCLILLIALLFKLRPEIIHYSTPKAALLGSIAACIARTPLRIYTVRGIVFAGKKGIAFLASRFLEQLTCLLSYKVVCVSQSNQSYLLDQGICSKGKLSIIGSGSSHGVAAINKFNPALIALSVKNDLRKVLNIPNNSVVFGFVGRLVRDKGAEELLLAGEEFFKKHDTAHLVIIGDNDEPRQKFGVASIFRGEQKRLHVLGPKINSIDYYAIMDVFVLPSHREGFPNVVLEAGAMQLPVITTDAQGCVDSVINNVTGLQYACGDTAGLLSAMERLFEDKPLRLQLGRNGRERALREFNPDIICNGLLKLYRDGLSK